MQSPPELTPTQTSMGMQDFDNLCQQNNATAALEAKRARRRNILGAVASSAAKAVCTAVNPTIGSAISGAIGNKLDGFLGKINNAVNTKARDAIDSWVVKRNRSGKSSNFLTDISNGLK